MADKEKILSIFRTRAIQDGQTRCTLLNLAGLIDLYTTDATLDEMPVIRHGQLQWIPNFLVSRFEKFFPELGLILALRPGPLASCPSVRLSVRPSVCLSVCLSACDVRPNVEGTAEPETQ